MREKMRFETIYAIIGDVVGTFGGDLSKVIEMPENDDEHFLETIKHVQKAFKEYIGKYSQNP